ncbi:MAG: hypothetical protein ABI067_12210 [Leifsonia sp.]
MCAGVLAFALTVGASVASFADDGTDDDSGRLNLNSDVLVNESVGTGATGDFAIRGRLFSPQLSARSHALDVASSTRLAVAGGLDFRLPESTDVEYRALRGGLFDGYSVKALPARGANQETSSALYGLLLVAGVPLVLLGGVLLGRFWVGRKRATA